MVGMQSQTIQMTLNVPREFTEQLARIEAQLAQTASGNHFTQTSVLGVVAGVASAATSLRRRVSRRELFTFGVRRGSANDERTIDKLRRSNGLNGGPCAGWPCSGSQGYSPPRAPPSRAFNCSWADAARTPNPDDLP